MQTFTLIAAPFLLAACLGPSQRAASGPALAAMPRPKLTPAAIAGILDEFVTFAQANAATLAARDGTDALTSLRQHHSKEEKRFYMFLSRYQSRLMEAHRRQLVMIY